MLLAISNFIPVLMTTNYRIRDLPMSCVWLHFRGRALASLHWIR